MASNAEVAAKLLRDAAKFFLSIGEQNPSIQAAMEANAKTFHVIAGLVETDPQGECMIADPLPDEEAKAGTGPDGGGPPDGDGAPDG